MKIYTFILQKMLIVQSLIIYVVYNILDSILMSVRLKM